MASIISFQRNSGRVSVLKGYRQPAVRLEDTTYDLNDLNPSLARFDEFWALMETVQKHGYIRAAMSVIGRSSVGAWWTLRRHPEYGKNATEGQRKRLANFYAMKNRSWDNIADYYNFAYKLMIGVMYLRYFGQAAYHVLRDENGKPVGMDFLHGMVVPHVDGDGKFKDPAFFQYPSSDPTEKILFKDPFDIVYMVNPSWEGSPLGGSDIEALTEFILPLDLYLQAGAREYMKNRDKPEAVYSLPADISDDAFEEFVKQMEAKYAGPMNLGRNPIAVTGDFKVTELDNLPDSLPYNKSRADAREEELAVAGVSGSLLGITESMASANIRENRRQFHETSVEPLFKFFELYLYEQIHIRTMNIPGWEFALDNPDFLNAVEKATVDMRYHQIGVLNPNEIRHDSLGKEPRDDEAGDAYVDEEEETEDEPENQPGSPPEGRPVEPDDPGQVGEPTNDDQDPPRGDQHDDRLEAIMKELHTWKRFAVRRVKKGKDIRTFRSDILEKEVVGLVTTELNDAKSVDDVIRVFDIVFDVVEKTYG